MNPVIRQAARGIRWTGRRLRLFFLLALLLMAVAGEGPPPGALSTGVGGVVGDLRFDFWDWEATTIWVKFGHWLLQPQRYMREPDRSAFVRDYATRVEHLQELQRQIAILYADPAIEDPAVASAEAQAEVDRLRAETRGRQLVAEAIIEEHVGLVLAGDGMGYLGQPFPPAGVRFTPLPYLLIVSARERIEAIHQQELQHGLDVAQQEAIEEQVDAAFDVSSLVTAVGGVSAWPAMLLENPSLSWAMEVAAHEWTHHYLALHPLGWEYDRGHEARTINETTASIVGREVGRAVLARYYPDLLPPPVEDLPPQEERPAEPPRFDFQTEMHETRVRVDELLAEGQVEAAECYMEERRQFFWEHGYRIRKLNQAYFAFHGSYAHEAGAAGEDPIGPAVRQLRERAGSLRAFLVRINDITTLARLQEELAERQD